MQQLSSGDCDKWLSMTLTMKERFFSSAAGEEGRRRREGTRDVDKQLEGSVASVAARPGPVRPGLAWPGRTGF